MIKKSAPKIKVVGIGTTGVGIVSTLSVLNDTRVELVGIDTSSEVLRNCKIPHLQIGKNIAHGLQTGDHYKGRLAAEESEKDIKLYLDNSDLNFLVVPLWGGIGLGATPKICEISHECRIPIICLVLKPHIPFGPQKLELAETTIKHIRDKINTLIIIEVEKLTNYLNLSIDESTKVVKKMISDIILCLLQPMLSHSIEYTSFINFFNDMKESYIGQGIATGKFWTKNIMESILNSPMLADKKIDLAEKMYLSIGCNPDTMSISMFETVIGYFQRHVKTPHNLLRGWYREKSNEVKLTLLIGKFKKSKHGHTEHKIQDTLKPLLDDFIIIPSYKRYKLHKLK